MDDELQKPEPKISLVVGILVLIICLIMDIIGLIPGADDIEEVPAVIGTAVSALLGIGPAMIALELLVSGLKAIPVIQELPLWTFGWIVVWVVENHPSKATQLIQKGLDAAAVAEGDAEALGEESTAVGEEVAAASASAEQSAEIAADREALTGETSSSRGSESNFGNRSAGQGSGDEEEQEEGQPQDQGDKNDIQLGDEVEPEEQAAAQDFGTPEPTYDSGEEEEEEKPNDKVIDIRTKKPLKRPDNKTNQDEDSQQAA